ncbi:Uncharacterized protein FWK35_00014868 [Aphis craccivora]|uniref:BED-type domain-containing protein n=1 Tax=Aphis craccivora TaxID=307492 RepID=A0A6G0YD52_APHCR|nr:Uncharacterized protein FWK35_00014868 [Aphis craccivora]
MNENVLMKWPSINKYFEQLESDCQNNLLFKCLLCMPKIKKISTSKSSNSNLRTHIKLVHPNDLDNFNNSAKKRSNTSLNQCSKQLKIEEVGKISVKKLTQAEFDAANLQLIVSCTVQWIDPQTLQRHSKGLACRRMIDRHTYDHIAEAIDNAANFVKAFRVFNNDNGNSIQENGDFDELDNPRPIEISDVLDNVNIEKTLNFSLPPHQRCAAHTLNLIATGDILEAEKDATYKTISRRVFSKCQSIFNKQNQSTLCADKVKEILGRYLITPNATRWNSYYDAINCIVENIDKIDDICIKLELVSFSRPREVGFLKEYCKVMKPLSKALDVLQGDKSVCLGFLLPTINAVHKSLNGLNNNVVFCKPLILALKRGLNKRFNNYFMSKSCQVAASLIPKFKLNWTANENRDEIKQDLIEIFENSDSEDDFLCFRENEIISENNDSELLINNYLSNSNLTQPLDLPKALKDAYIKYNTAVPSSAHVERLFSAGGQLYDKRRGSMCDKNVEMSLLLKFNKFFDD